MKKLTCKIGDKFGEWTVIDTPFSKKGKTYVKVQCSCGRVSEQYLGDLIHSRIHSCKHCSAQRRGHIKELHLGDKIKNWTIIGGPRVYHNTVQFRVQCTCGSERWIQPNELLNPNKCFSCQKCAHKHPDILFPAQFNRLRKSAKIRNIEFLVGIPYLNNLWETQSHRCAITGDLISSIKKASLDRIDSSIGYIEGNVQWVTTRANVSKHTMTMNELYNFCRKVLNHANQQPSQV